MVKYLIIFLLALCASLQAGQFGIGWDFTNTMPPNCVFAVFESTNAQYDIGRMGVTGLAAPIGTVTNVTGFKMIIFTSNKFIYFQESNPMDFYAVCTSNTVTHSISTFATHK